MTVSLSWIVGDADDDSALRSALLLLDGELNELFVISTTFSGEVADVFVTVTICRC